MTDSYCPIFVKTVLCYFTIEDTRTAIRVERDQCWVTNTDVGSLHDQTRHQAKTLKTFACRSETEKKQSISQALSLQKQLALKSQNKTPRQPKEAVTIMAELLHLTVNAVMGKYSCDLSIYETNFSYVIFQ